MHWPATLRCHFCHVAALFCQAVLLCCMGASYSLADEPTQWKRGPITIYNHYPLQAVHLSAAPRSPETLPENRFEILGLFSWSNTFVDEESYRIDAEYRELRTQLTYGVTDRLSLHSSLPLNWRGGGVLDGLIDWWHDVFRLPEGNRDQFARDNYLIAGLDESGAAFSAEDDGLFLGNVTLGSKYLLSRGGSSLPAVSVFAEVSLPTAENSFGHDGVDASGALLLSKKIGKFYLYSSTSVIFFSDTHIEGIQYNSWHPEQSLFVEYAFSPRFSAQTGLTWIGDVLDGIPEHPHHALYHDVGVQYEAFEGTELSLALRENPSGTKGSLDVEFIFGIRSRF